MFWDLSSHLPGIWEDNSKQPMDNIVKSTIYQILLTVQMYAILKTINYKILNCFWYVITSATLQFEIGKFSSHHSQEIFHTGC